MEELLLRTGYGALGGLGWSLLRIAYHKADPGDSPDVEYKRIAKTVILGALVGAYAGYQGETVSADVIEALVSTGKISMAFTAIVDTVVNLGIRLWKRFVK